MLKDYRAHYTADAALIEDPAALSPVRYASERRRLQTLLRALGLRGERAVLDVGCGSGWLAHECGLKGARVVASDISLQGVAGARRRYPDAGDFLVADAYHMPFDTGAFDVVVLSEVLEHMEDVDGALSEARRMLRPGGRLVVTVPLRETILQHLCIHCNQLTPANAHLHSFDTGLCDHLSALGLTVRQVLVLNNKLLEYAGFPHRSRHWPFWMWKTFDSLCNRLTGKAGFLLVAADKA